MSNDNYTIQKSEEDLLEEVTSNDLYVAIAAAQSPDATESILDIAAHDKDREVRLAAVNNPNLGVKTLKILCSDKDAEISHLAKEKWRMTHEMVLQ